MFKVLRNKSAIITTLKYTIIQAIRKADCDISTPADFSTRRNLAEDCKAGCPVAFFSVPFPPQLTQTPQMRNPLVISFLGLGSLSALSNSDWGAAKLVETSITPCRHYLILTFSLEAPTG